MPLKFDDEPGIGWGPFKLPDTHPFHDAAIVHDNWYSDIRDGTATKTLKQIDREFLRNCLRAAWSERSIFLMHEAWVFYRIVRFWAKNVRPELDAFRPSKDQDINPYK